MYNQSRVGDSDEKALYFINMYDDGINKWMWNI